MRVLARVLAVVLLLAVASPANSEPPAGEGAAQLIIQKMKETRPVVLLSPWRGPAYSAFLPVWTFHSAYDKDASGQSIPDVNKDYVNVGVGGKYETATKTGDAFIGLDVNVVALSARAWGFAWADLHVKRTKLPPIFAGVSYVMPLAYQDLRNTTAKRDVRGMFGLKVVW